MVTKAQEYLDACVPEYKVEKRPVVRTVPIYEEGIVESDVLDAMDEEDTDEEGEPLGKKKNKARKKLVRYEEVIEEESYVKLYPNVPSKGGLAVHLKVARETLYDWANKYPEFSDIMERLGSQQEKELISKGLDGSYNPTISKVLLTKHGYREGIEQSGADGKPLNENVADAITKIYGGTEPTDTDGKAD